MLDLQITNSFSASGKTKYYIVTIMESIIKFYSNRQAKLFVTHFNLSSIVELVKSGKKYNLTVDGVALGRTTRTTYNLIQKVQKNDNLQLDQAILYPNNSCESTRVCVPVRADSNPVHDEAQHIELWSEGIGWVNQENGCVDSSDNLRDTVCNSESGSNQCNSLALAEPLQLVTGSTHDTNIHDAIRQAVGYQDCSLGRGIADSLIRIANVRIDQQQIAERQQSIRERQCRIRAEQQELKSKSLAIVRAQRFEGRREELRLQLLATLELV